MKAEAGGPLWERHAPGRLQHHDGVLALKSAGRGEVDIDVGEPTAVRVAMATTGHATSFNASNGGPGGEGFQASSQGMELRAGVRTFRPGPGR